MSSTWYRAVCDEHKVFIDVMVNDPLRTAHLLGDVATPIKQWLILHYGCDLRLVWRDDQLDLLWETHKEEKLPGTPCPVCGETLFRMLSITICVHRHSVPSDAPNGGA